MIFANLFELDEVHCIEDGFADLPDDEYTTMILSFPADAARLLIDETERPFALALHTPAGWQATSFAFRSFSSDVIDYLSSVETELYQEEKKVCDAVLRAYFNDRLCEQIQTPPIDDNRPGRSELVRELITEYWGPQGEGVVIDGCAGSGVVSSVLREMGWHPMAYDNDPELIVLGLATGRYLPEDVIWIDGALAPDYIEEAPRGIACMMGDITAFNAPMWEELVLSFLDLCPESLITVATEGEAERISAWCSDYGYLCEIHENDRDPIYDHWVCVISRES
jgi:hypothetical protein